MKEKVNEENNLVRRNRCDNCRVCNYHSGSGRFCRSTANHPSKSRGAPNASRFGSFCSHSKRNAVAEDGSVTAEFAVILPAVFLVLLFALSALAIQASRIGLIELSAEASRALARGEQLEVARSLIDQAAQGVAIKLEIDHTELMVCVTLVKSVQISLLGGLVPLNVSERQCARKSGL